MRTVALGVTGLLLHAATAHAGLKADARATWDADNAYLAHTFFVDPDDARNDEVQPLVDALELKKTDYPIPSEYFAWVDPIDHLYTGTIDANDRAVCRWVTMMSLVGIRQAELRRGRPNGFTFDIKCGDYELTGTWYPYVDSSPYKDNGKFLMTETAAGEDTDEFSAILQWTALPPDVEDLHQWGQAAVAPVEYVMAHIDRVLTAIDQHDGETSASFVTQWIQREIEHVQGFAVADDGADLIAAELEWLQKTKADLDSGTLHQIIERTGPDASKKKSYVKKTKAMRKKWSKARGKRDRAMLQMFDDYIDAHPKQP